MPFTQKIARLPESGSLAPSAPTQPNTIEDLTAGMYEQNKVINYIADNMEKLADVVKDHTPVVDAIRNLHTTAKTLLFVLKGLGLLVGFDGIVKIIQWLASFHH